MFKCRKCGCNCDNADIINGICDDCRNEIERQKEKQDMLAVEGTQMEFDFCAGHKIQALHRKEIYNTGQ